MLSNQEHDAREASQEFKDARTSNYRRVTGCTLNTYALLSTCALLDHIKRLESRIEGAKNCLVCVDIADPAEICDTVYGMLNNEPDFSVAAPELHRGQGL